MDETGHLQQKIEHLERELAQRIADDDVREVEFRSLQQEVELKAEYISRLERIEDEVIAPKDVHIRNLEAIIANFKAEREPDRSGSGSSTSRTSRLRRRGRD
jgi:hypothetical protein